MRTPAQREARLQRRIHAENYNHWLVNFSDLSLCRETTDERTWSSCYCPWTFPGGWARHGCCIYAGTLGETGDGNEVIDGEDAGNLSQKRKIEQEIQLPSR